MDWLRHHMRDHLSNVRPFPAPEKAADTGRTKPQVPEAGALDLVHAAADLLKGVQEHSAAVETRARALASRASDELKAARNRIQTLQMDCDNLTAAAAESKDQALAAEQSLQEAQKQIAMLEVELAAAEKRAGEAEQMLLRVEEAIRFEILEPQRSNKPAAAAA